MTIIEQIKAYIERQIKDPQEHCYGVSSVNKLRELLDFIGTLEKSEKPMQEGLEEEITRKVGDKRLFETGLYPYDCVCDIARHFAQWGAEHLANSNDEIVINGHKVAYNMDKDVITMEEIPNDLEEAAKKYATEWHENPDGSAWKPYFEVSAIKAFIAGAKWDRSKIMQEAAEGTIDYVYDEKGDAYKAIRLDWLVGDFGDKVKLYIVKED